MGDVDLLTSQLQRALRGEPVNAAPLLRFIRKERGITANKRLAAGSALLFTPHREEAVETVGDMLLEQERNGPRPWEFLCPDSHAGIYGLADAAIVRSGEKRRQLAERQAVLTGQRLALYDLIATPDGDVTGLPGMRANDPTGPKRMCETMEYREIRGLPHRGTGKHAGNTRRLESFKPTTDEQGVYSAPAWWWRQILATPAGRTLTRKGGPLSREACPPARMRLGLTIHRWEGGTQAELDDPGPERRREFMTFGSFAARKDADRTEDCTSWVRVVHGKPGRHEVTCGLSWQTEPPPVPKGATRIELGQQGGT